MKRDFVFTVPVLFATLCAASMVHAGNSVHVKVENKCSSPVPFTIQKKGSSLNTSLSPRSSITHLLDASDRIVVGKSLVHTVSAASDRQPVIVCSK